MMMVICGIIVLSLILAAFFGTGAMAWFGRVEHPERIMGKNLVLHDFDGVAAAKSPLYRGRISAYDEMTAQYRIDFENGLESRTAEKFAHFGARHKGWPVSAANKHGLTAVQGVLESGRQFIAFVNLD
jgi:hypothetical protein